MEQELLGIFERQETARRFSDLDRRSVETSRQLTGFREAATQRLTRIEERIQHAQIPLDGMRSEFGSLRKEVLVQGDKLEASLVELRGQIRDLGEILNRSLNALNRRIG